MYYIDSSGRTLYIIDKFINVDSDGRTFLLCIDIAGNQVPVYI